MKELHQVVSHKLADMISSGVIEGIIEKNLVTLVEESVKSSLRSYGDFGKFVQEKVEASVMAAKGDISLPLYNTFIAETVHKAYSKALHEGALPHFEQLISEALKPVPENAKFSDLMNEIRDQWAGDAADGEIEIDVEDNSFNCIRVLIKHPEYDWHNIRATFYSFKKETWHIGYLCIGDKKVSSDIRLHADQGLSGSDLGDIFFKYYLAQTEFEADEEFENIYLSDF